jgi:hypothetical protein
MSGVRCFRARSHTNIIETMATTRSTPTTHSAVAENDHSNTLNHLPF